MQLTNNDPVFVSSSYEMSTELQMQEEEKLAKYMVDSGMISVKLAQEALSLVRKHSVGFDEAVIYLEKANETKPSSESKSRSHISGVEASVLRRLVENNKLTSEKASQLVKDSLHLEISVLSILTRLNEFSKPKVFEAEAVTLLINANLVDEKNQKQNDCWKQAKALRPLVQLIARGVINERLEEAALNCAELIHGEEMSHQEGKMILRYVSDYQVNFEDAVNELGLSYGQEDDQESSVEGIALAISGKLSSWSKSLCARLNYQT